MDRIDDKKLLVCLLALILSVYAILPKPLLGRDISSFLVEELASQLALVPGKKIFQGQVFSQSMTAWQIKADEGYSQLLRSLSRQNILQQYHSIGNVMMLSGEYAQHTVLLQLERLGPEAYQGILSVMPMASPSFSERDSQRLSHYLLKESRQLATQSMAWLPLSATLLMHIKNSPWHSQFIYLDSMNPQALNTLITANLAAAGWQKNSSEEFGLSLWRKESQELQLYFSQQAEGTALYVLSHDLSKDIYEDSHQ